MSTTPPEGSEIKIDFENGIPKLIIPQSSGGFMRFFIGAFLLFWLGGWAFGWITVARQLAKGNSPAELFLIFWLGAWTVGGILAFWFLYRIVRSSVPETIFLSRPHMVYDSGVTPFQISFGFRSQMDMWKKLFQKRIRTEFNQTHLKTLRLREFDTGNRLTIDQGNKRIEVGAGASEPEREWLFKLIHNKYNS